MHILILIELDKQINMKFGWIFISHLTLLATLWEEKKILIWYVFLGKWHSVSNITVKLDLTRGYFEGYCYGDEWRLWLGQKQAVIRQNRSVSCFNEQAYSLYTVFAIVSLKNGLHL